MKKIALLFLTLFLVVGMTATASAKTGSPGFEIDGSFGFASGPGDFDAGFGTNFGAGYMLDSVLENLQARIDVSYFDFSREFFLMDLEYTRVPVTISARYYFPITDQFRAFAQAGVETSFDSFDTVFPFAGNFIKQSESEVNIGLSPAGGVDFAITPNISVFAIGRWHLISDNYFSIHFGGAFHF
jgi:opacity protein-like surface antigen